MKKSSSTIKRIIYTFLLSLAFFGLFYLLYSHLKSTAISLISIALVSFYAWFRGISYGILLAIFNVVWITIALRLSIPDYNPFKTDGTLGSIFNLASATIIGYVGRLSRQLQSEVEERKKAQALLTTYQNELEQRVEERTRELEIANEKLHQAEKMEAIGKLAGSIAHDFKNYLTIILGYTNILLKKLDETSQEHTFVQQIHKSGENATELTTELLTFAHKERFIPVPINLNMLLDNIQVLLSKSVNSNITIKIEVQKDLPQIMGGESKIQNALLNLVINARDALGEEGGTITISTETHTATPEFCKQYGISNTTGTFAALKVSDNGNGIPPDILPYIFEPFYTTKPKGKGTGMGLATVYGIVKSHKGAVIVKSPPLEGTTFTLLFPFATKEDIEQAARQQSE